MAYTGILGTVAARLGNIQLAALPLVAASAAARADTSVGGEGTVVRHLTSAVVSTSLVTATAGTRSVTRRCLRTRVAVKKRLEAGVVLCG